MTIPDVLAAATDVLRAARVEESRGKYRFDFSSSLFHRFLRRFSSLPSYQSLRGATSSLPSTQGRR
jgi:hypothetical protein